MRATAINVITPGHVDIAGEGAGGVRIGGDVFLVPKNGLSVRNSRSVDGQRPGLPSIIGPIHVVSANGTVAARRITMILETQRAEVDSAVGVPGDGRVTCCEVCGQRSVAPDKARWVRHDGASGGLGPGPPTVYAHGNAGLGIRDFKVGECSD